MYFTNIIAAGCSFTQDGISGIPPNDNGGGNSFLDYPDDNIKAAIPNTWAGIIAKNFAAKSFVNVAASGHGNLLLSNSVLTLLKKFPYQANNTLILFNITEPARLDIPCRFDHPDRSVWIPWSPDIIEHAYLGTQYPNFKVIKKDMGIDAISYLSTNSLIFLLDFLNYRKYKFAFMTMADYSCDRYLSPLIDSNQQNFLPLDNQIGMMEFCVSNNMTVSDSDHHPNIDGHQLIAKKMIEFLERV